MSIIVNGMTMPDSCAVCRFAGKGGYRMERVVCMFTGKNEDAVKVDRLPDCPLVALPDKHGRLVDADALIADCQLAQKQADRHGREFANAFYSGGGEVSTEWWCVEDMIENAPTIVESEGGE